MSNDAAYQAAHNGEFDEMIKLLLVDPASAQYISPDSKYTLLHQAAWHGDMLACGFLLGLGGVNKLNALNARGETPYNVAIRQGNLTCASRFESICSKLPQRTAASVPATINPTKPLTLPVQKHPALPPASHVAAAAKNPILVISDPHGHLNAVKRALVEAHKRIQPTIASPLEVVLIGDFCDNGPHIKALLNFLCEAQKNGEWHIPWF